VVHFFASNSFKTPVEVVLVDLLKRLCGCCSTLVRWKRLGLAAPLALACLAAVPCAWARQGCRAISNSTSGLSRHSSWHGRSWAALSSGISLYGHDAREFLAGLASNISLDKFRAVIKIKIK